MSLDDNECENEVIRYEVVLMRRISMKELMMMVRKNLVI
jgi:hypothetical protein